MHFDKTFLIILNMLKEYLDREVYNLIIKNFSFNDITEIRMRVNQNLIIVVKNKKYYLKDSENNYVKVNNLMIENFIKRASQNSLYAYNDSVINGYLTLNNGIRVGLSGYVVLNEDRVSTIKDFQAINIRIPHLIKNCSLNAYPFLAEDEVKNSLIISAPGCGKTTFIRDFIYQLNLHNNSKNVLIVDERNEICSVVNSQPQIELGGFCDVYTNCTKQFAFKNGIRSMCPDVIVTDELDLEKDLNCVLEAMNCGVNVVATIHAKDIEQLKRKAGFDYVLDNKLFSRYVILSNKEGAGTLEAIYDEKLNVIFCR